MFREIFKSLHKKLSVYYFIKESVSEKEALRYRIYSRTVFVTLALVGAAFLLVVFREESFWGKFLVFTVILQWWYKRWFRRYENTVLQAVLGISPDNEDLPAKAKKRNRELNRLLMVRRGELVREECEVYGLTYDYPTLKGMRESLIRKYVWRSSLRKFPMATTLLGTFIIMLLSGLVSHSISRMVDDDIDFFFLVMRSGVYVIGGAFFIDYVRRQYKAYKNRAYRTLLNTINFILYE